MDPSRLKEEAEPSHEDNASPGLIKSDVKLDGDFAEQEKMDTQSKAADHRQKEKFATDWFIE